MGNEIKPLNSSYPKSNLPRDGEQVSSCHLSASASGTESLSEWPPLKPMLHPLPYPSKQDTVNTVLSCRSPIVFVLDLLGEGGDCWPETRECVHKNVFKKKEGGVSHSGQGNKSHFGAVATDFMFCSKLESDSALCCHCLSLISDRLPHRCEPHPQSQMCKKYHIMSLNLISVCELPFHWTGRKFNPLFLGCPPMGLYEVSGSPRH